MNSGKKQNRRFVVLRKNIIGLIGILIVISLTACGNKPEASKEDTQNVQTDLETARPMQETEIMAVDLPIELYVNVLRNYISAGKTDFAVSFIDLDDDSIREMVVFFGESQADGGCLFTIKNGEAIQVVAEDSGFFGKYGTFTYKEKGNVFVTENESVTEVQISSQIFYYALENGKAVCKDMTQSITQFDSGESRFYINDTEVEKEKFNSIAENYGLLEMSTVSYADGVRVMNEQMNMVYDAYAAYGQVKEDETANAKESPVNQQENSVQTVENADSEKTAEELLDLFTGGTISAVDSTDPTSTFYITDLNMDSGEWDSYSVGEKVDLDNDGEMELIINGSYGGMYLDARNNMVYKFATGDGNACILSYTYFNGTVWILYSNRMNTGYEAYHMEKYEGADNLAAEINFGEELVNPDSADSEKKYTWNGSDVSYDEYTAFCSKIFAAEVSTN